jgi:hypothetical protein
MLSEGEHVMGLFRKIVLSVLFFPALVAAQQSNGQQGTPCMPGMRMPGCPDTSGQQAGDQQSSSGQPAQQSGGNEGTTGMKMGKTGLMSMQGMQPQTFLQAIAHHATSGTSAEPNSTPTPMLMANKGPWMIMFHANAFVLDQQQSGPRGGDKLFSVNWLMPMAQREIGRGVFTIRTMLSLDPATVTKRRYPLLFQQGEAAFGKPIADGQHPHDFFMELAVLYDLKLGEKSLLSFYVAPIGDPAIGPTAYPHRASATENPLATLGHHQQDSTHVAADVVTLGLTYDRVRVEASGFHGREPDENRWNIDQGTIDSWSTRVTVAPDKNWSGQVSYGRIQSPEALSPSEDQQRMTASVTYNRPFGNGNWASTILWGRTRSLPDNAIFNSYLLESTVRFRTRNYAWTRIENAERSNELIFGENPLPAGFQETPIGRVQAYTLGYDRDFNFVPHLATAIGAQASIYGVPDSLRPVYGARPAGVAVFVRLRPFSEMK